MSKSALTAIAGGLLVLLFLVALPGVGLSFDIWPEDINPIETETEVATAAPAEVISIEPLTLSCRARINMHVAVTVKREFKLFGQNISDSTVVDANYYGDVDTCLDDTAASEIIPTADGRFLVRIDRSRVRFVRPRIDHSDPRETVAYREGTVSELVGVIPGTADDDNLKEYAAQYAQAVFASGACMNAAWPQTEQAIVAAYQYMASERGIPSSDVLIEFVGEVEFPPNTVTELALGNDITLSTSAVECHVAEGANDQRPE